MRRAAHAKINLTLEVHGTRPDGYHDLRSVVLPIPLHDDIELTPAADLTVEMAGDLPPEKNLAWKAADVLRRATGCRRGARIAITNPRHISIQNIIIIIIAPIKPSSSQTMAKI